MKINGKTYETPTLNFSALCAMEKQGLPIDDMSTRPLAFLCAFAALAMGTSLEEAQQELDAHMASGGSLDEISNALNAAVEASGFFKGAAATIPA